MEKNAAGQTHRAIEVKPDDEHNRRLLANVHPSQWTNPNPPPRYNAVVIGAGAAGLVTAAGLAGLGARVALIERNLLGGDCLNVGCVPSKALIRAARAAAEVRDAGKLGVQIPHGAQVDFPAVMERTRRLRAAMSPVDSAGRFRNLGVDVYFGQATFAGPDTVEVAGAKLRFKKAVIATGARAANLPIPGLSDVEYLTNESVFTLTERPQRLGVIGAGPIGCELAQAFARFGSNVYLIESAHGILPNEDRDAAEIVEQSLRRDGVTLLCCGKELRIEQSGGAKRLVVDSHDQRYDLEVDQILVAAGRTPNVEGLGLEAAGVQFNRHGVLVNDRLQTTNKNIYAAGDICSKWKFTHAADAMARIVIQNAFFFGRSRVSALTMPWCTYTSPEIAHVGLYEGEASKLGIAVDTFDFRFNELDRAILDGETEGFIRVLVRRGSDKILGGTVVGTHAGEIISELSMAMTGRLGLGTIARTIHPYPTHAEAIKKVADAYNRNRLTPGIRALFERWFAWRR
ncbi:MAG: mercuric reductase [Planctomycetales bacterium]|nr:mercuric reductase [Planctomycetales bacterium]